MTTPHTVSIINFQNEQPYLTILRGVMLQALDGRSVQRRGDLAETNAVLYVPLAVTALNPAGEKTDFLAPIEYAHCSDPSHCWTLQTEGESAGRSTFFVKGRLSAPCTLAEARERYDFVYVVAGWQLHDYGTQALRHFEVLSRVSSRYYSYGQ